MTIGKNNKLMSHLNHRMRVVVQDSRVFVGYFKAFDKHMNIILSECEEHRRIKPKPGKKLNSEEEKRVLGLVLLRGDIIISLSVAGAPQKDDDIKMPTAAKAAPRAAAAPPMPNMPPPQMPGLQGVQAMPPTFRGFQ